MRCGSVTVWAGCTAVALCGAPAVAGPWAREAGDLFVSFQISVEEQPAHVMAGLWDPEPYASLYAEYGMGRRLTLGVDLGGGDDSAMGTAFLRYTLTPPDATWQWTVDAGLGQRRIGDSEEHGLLRIGASVGRGFGEGGGGWPMPIVHEGGWIALDAAVLYDQELEDVIWQAEGTLGFSLSERTGAIVSLKAEGWPGNDMIVTVAPSLTFDILPDTTLRLGARGALEGSTNVGVVLSLWHTF